MTASATTLVVFDLDGTLVDSRLDLATAANAALEETGLPTRRDEEIASFVGEGARKLMERAVAPRQDLLEPALAAFFRRYDRCLLDRTRDYAGIRDVLDGLGKTPLAVATNKPGRFARRILQGLGLLERFVAVLGGDDGPRKPDPAMVDRLRGLVAAPRESVVLVGDSKVDVATAHGAQVSFVGVTWGFGSRDELLAAGALESELVATPVELLARLRR